MIKSSMAVLLENVTNCLALAFVSLQNDHKNALVAKSKLKVLTANIGTLLDLYGVEKGLEHFKSSQVLDFHQFKYYLQKEVFASLSDNMHQLKTYEDKISEVAWLVCRPKYLKSRLFDELTTYRLFRIFCLLAECNEQNLVLLHPSEAALIAEKLAQLLGMKWDDDDFTSLSISMGSFPLGPFLTVLETRCVDSIVDNDAINEAVNDLYQNYVQDVIKKGYLAKKGFILHNFKEYWFVLRPGDLSYYKTRSEKEKCGCINLQQGNRIEIKEDFKLIVHTTDRNYELQASDHISRLQWFSGLLTAIEHSVNSKMSYQRMMASMRKQQRQGRLQEMLKAKEQLQNERLARKVAEGQAKELEAQVREEAKKLLELETIKEKLEKLLEEETQAKRDEEIVRALQARILAEEWEKREEMEKLQKEQNLLLEEERDKRKEFEELQKNKEKQLNDAQKQLESLQSERELLDQQLQSAMKKIKASENCKELLEQRLQQVVPLRDNQKAVRRSFSFVPSTKEKPVTIEIRSSTLRKK